MTSEKEQLDVGFVRSLYPAFQQREIAEWAFFENAGGSYVPEPVIERLDRFFRCYKVQPYGPFESSVIAGEAMDEGYRCIARLLNANDDALTLGPSTTLNCYVLAHAIRPTLAEGDEVIVTNQDHEANIGCWERLGTPCGCRRLLICGSSGVNGLRRVRYSRRCLATGPVLPNG